MNAMLYASDNESEEVDIDAIIASRAGVKTEIQAVIAPYRTRTEKPPFSTGELIVMAILSSVEYGLTKPEILRRIVRTFRYYLYKAADSYIEGMANELHFGDDDYAVNWPVHNFFAAFDDYDLPLSYAGFDNALAHAMDEMDDEFIVGTAEGRLYLSRVLAPEFEDSFRFLDLPAELRNTIYLMVLAFPRSGLGVGYTYKSSGFHAMARRHQTGDLAEDPLKWFDGNCTMPVGSTQKILAILSVNKQINQEAMPFFYGCNTFFFENTPSMSGWLKHLVPQRAQHLTAIVMKYSPFGRWRNDTIEDCMTRVAQLNGLKTLIVKCGEIDGDIVKPRSRKPLEDRKIPSFRMLCLAASKVEKLEVKGECPAFIARFHGEVAKLKAKAKPATAPRKRTRATKAKVKNDEKLDGADDDGEGPKKKARKPTA